MMHILRRMVACRAMQLAMLLQLCSGGGLALAQGSDALPAQAMQGRTLQRHLQQLADDDPHAVVQQVQRLRASAQAAQLFWLALGEVRAQTLLEDTPRRLQALAAAERQLGPQATRQQRLALRIEQLSAMVDRAAPAQIHAELAALRKDVNAAGDTDLSCELTSLELWLLIDAGSFDEAWLVAEVLERCGRDSPRLLSSAYASMGQIASAAGLEANQQRQPTAYFQRALAALGDAPARFQRSIIEWDLGLTHQRLRQHDAALTHLQRAREMSESLRDRVGVAAANIGLVRVHLDRRHYQQALPLLDEARQLLQGHHSDVRALVAQELRIRALTGLKSPNVLAEIELGRTLDRPELGPLARQNMAYAMADAYASMRLHERAFAELQRALQLDKARRELARDAQLLRLQTRYDLAKREAENAALRHQSEVAALALERQTAQRERLVVVIALLAVLAVAGLSLALRQMARRRALADLALRDELTGSPNRRAVTAYAQAQFEQARKLAVPLTVALIDLDHFKQVNDQHGHATGDELLRAFVHAVMPVLRGQDRLGRWGGEEWLLVLPGTQVDELPPLFARMRESFAGVHVPGLPSPHGQTFSMGAASLQAHSTNLAALIQAADGQLYRAKAQGRNRLAPTSVQAPVAAANNEPL